MKSYVLTALFSVISVGAMADSYQSQTDVNYGWANLDKGDLSNWDLKQRFYLAPVQTQGAVPLAEAAFMQRQASLSAGFNRLTANPDNVDKSHLNSWSLGGEYMDSQHNYYAALDWEFSNGSKAYEGSAKLGYFVQNDWLVTADLYHTKDWQGQTQMEYGASTKKLLDLNSGDFIALTGGFRNLHHSTDTLYEVGADYYLGKNLSVGVGYQWLSPGVFQTKNDGFEVRSQWFALPNLALNASVGRVYQDELGLRETAYQVGASYRF
jgi:hypothetical protein